MYTVLCKELFKDTVTTISDFDIPAEVNDICYLPNDRGIALSVPSQHCIALLQKNILKYPWVGMLDKEIKGLANRRQNLLSYPSSLCCSEDGNAIYAVERKGLSVAKIETCSCSVFSAMDKFSIDKIEQTLSNAKDDSVAYIDYNRGHIYVSYEKINMSFTIDANSLSLRHFAGTGFPSYSVCSDYSRSEFRLPTGISFNGTRVYIADNGNNCIRSIYNDKIELIVGFPGFMESKDGQGTDALLKSVSKIRARDQFVSFIDDNKIRIFKEANRRVYTAYTSDRIVSFDLKGDKLYILEKK